MGSARAETKRQVIKESCNHPSRLVLLLRRFALCGVPLDANRPSGEAPC
jgi:hypothetical protein